MKELWPHQVPVLEVRGKRRRRPLVGRLARLGAGSRRQGRVLRRVLVGGSLGQIAEFGGKDSKHGMVGSPTLQACPCVWIYHIIIFCTYTHIRTYIHIRTCIYICTYVCDTMHTHTHAHTGTHICTRAHAHAHTFESPQDMVPCGKGARTTPHHAHIYIYIRSLSMIIPTSTFTVQGTL